MQEVLYDNGVKKQSRSIRKIYSFTLFKLEFYSLHEKFSSDF